MKLGVYFDLRRPLHGAEAPARLYGRTLELCEEVERLGLHSVWLSEHHGFEDGYLPQPLTFAAAIAARTRTVRIGTAVVLAPLRPTAGLAEEATVVDLISGGRLDLGLGTGYRRSEFDLYETAFAGRTRRLEEQVGHLLGLWRTGAVTPSPPRGEVPLWLGFNGPRGAHRAGRLGVGLLTADVDLVARYRDGLTAGGHRPTIARMAGPIPAFVTDDPEADWPLVAEHLAHQQNSYRRHASEGGEPPPPLDPDRWRARGLGKVGSSFLHATPAAAAEAIRARFAGTPVETVFLFASVGGMADDVVERHIAAIGRLGTLLARAPAGSPG